MNTHVSRQLAELAKEKGFEQKHDVGVVCRITNKVNPSFERTRPITESDIENSWCIFNEIYPTIADVVMWLYEKHGIWINLMPHKGENDLGTPFMEFDPEVWSFTNECVFHITGLFYFNSPTEAYEAAIEYVLTKLI